MFLEYIIGIGKIISQSHALRYFWNKAKQEFSAARITVAKLMVGRLRIRRVFVFNIRYRIADNKSRINIKNEMTELFVFTC
jgi:hypothetical protein